MDVSDFFPLVDISDFFPRRVFEWEGGQLGRRTLWMAGGVHFLFNIETGVYSRRCWGSLEGL